VHSLGNAILLVAAVGGATASAWHLYSSLRMLSPASVPKLAYAQSPS